MNVELLEAVETAFRIADGTTATTDEWPSPSWRVAFIANLASELEGRTQPTRDELADAIEADVKAAVFTAKGVREAALDAIDVLVARGWVGVSDTPNEAQ